MSYSFLNNSSKKANYANVEERGGLLGGREHYRPTTLNCRVNITLLSSQSFEIVK